LIIRLSELFGYLSFLILFTVPREAGRIFLENRIVPINTGINPGVNKKKPGANKKAPQGKAVSTAFNLRLPISH